MSMTMSQILEELGYGVSSAPDNAYSGALKNYFI